MANLLNNFKDDKNANIILDISIFYYILNFKEIGIIKYIYF